jgi:hypothetical protein
LNRLAVATRPSARSYGRSSRLILAAAVALLSTSVCAPMARPDGADAAPIAYPRLDPLVDIRRADSIVEATIQSQWQDSTVVVAPGQEPPTVARIRVRRVYKGGALTVGQLAEVRTLTGDLQVRGYWSEGTGVSDYGLSCLREDGQDMALMIRRTQAGFEVFRGFLSWDSSHRGWLTLAEASPERAPSMITELLCRMSVSARSRWELVFAHMYWGDDELMRIAPRCDLNAPMFRRILDRYEAEAIRRSKGAQWQDLVWLAPRMREPVRRRIVGILAARCDSSLAERARRRQQAHEDSIQEAERRARMTPEELRRVEYLETNPNIDHDVFAWMREPPDPADSHWLMLACMDSTRARRLRNERRPPDEAERAAILEQARAWGSPPRNWHPVRRMGRMGGYY